MSWQQIIFDILTYGILGYSVVLIFFYLFIGVYSIGETRKYLHKNSFTDYSLLAVSAETPGISIIAPAYNESATVVENVRSLLSVYYSTLELIIVNDGSKDNSLQLLIDAYQLEQVPVYIQEQIPTKPVRGVYKSRNPVFSKLVVIDKVNGGKADALNVGVNLATKPYV
ncbi:MAG TPA: glycosyltransferase, partial [Pseudobacter sp.]|nr:glycosyltransferase [Pseudobacter sp.]